MKHLRPFAWLAMGSMALFLVACSESEDATNAAAPAPAKPTVSIISASKETLTPSFEVPAVIEATQTARIRAEVNAVISSIDIDPGSLVQEGDLLVELNPDTYQAQLDEAKANHAAAQAALREASGNYDRAQKLKPDGYISEMDFDRIQASRAAAAAALQQAEAQLKQAELNLARTKIVAPFDGKVSAPLHAVGDRVGPLAAQPLFELVKLDPIYAVGEVDQTRYENFVLKRLELESRGIEIPEMELELRLPSGRTYPLTGTFENWDHSAMGQSGTIRGRAIFDNPDGLLLPGENVTLRGTLIEPVNTILIPQKAVLQDQQGHYIMAIVDGKVQRKNIEVGLRDGANWSVLSGLEEGDDIIVEGLQKVRPGIEVDTVAYQVAE